ncbi:MAG: hypothetical protein HRU09_08940 [Oligoflexales bacterium]|nr:hypothetical protein [Oligoflexales bacterium]
MIKKACALVSLAASLSMGTSFAGDLEKADAEFKNRGNLDFSQLTATRNLYKKVYDAGGLSTQDRINVATQIGRLDIYRGGLLPELSSVSVADQKKAIDECLEAADLIADTDSAQFHYLRTSCIAFRGKLETSILGRTKYGLMMSKAQGPALAAAGSQDGNFEAGGIFRVMSALRGNRKAKPLGLYDAAEALDYAEKALATPTVEDAFFETDFSGADYYENFYYQGQSQIALGIENEDLNLVTEGRDLLKSKVRRIDLLKGRNKLGERAPETLAYQALMKKLQAKVDACESESNWKSCLIEKLSD